MIRIENLLPRTALYEHRLGPDQPPTVEHRVSGMRYVCSALQRMILWTIAGIKRLIGQAIYLQKRPNKSCGIRRLIVFKDDFHAGVFVGVEHLNGFAEV
jgi:hypothetical protein